MGKLANMSNVIDIGTRCHLCGNDSAVAYWMGAGDATTVCRWCAIDILPKLIADAVCDKPITHKQLNEAFQKVKAEFYYAAALALCRKEHADDSDS